MRIWRHPSWHIPRSQLALRCCVVVGAAVVLLGAAEVGRVAPWLAAVVGLLTLGALVLPEAPLGLLLVATLALVWALLPKGSVTSPWVLLAALGLVLVHVSLHLAAQGPAVMRPDPAQLRLWSVRAVALWCSSALLWVAACWLRGTATPSAVYVLALVVLAASVVWIGQRTAQGPSA